MKLPPIDRVFFVLFLKRYRYSEASSQSFYTPFDVELPL